MTDSPKEEEERMCYPHTEEDLLEHLGEFIHTAFRKATDAPQSHSIWKLIQEMPSADWQAVLQFVAMSGSMKDDFGYGLAKLVEERNALEARVAAAEAEAAHYREGCEQYESRAYAAEGKAALADEVHVDREYRAKYSKWRMTEEDWRKWDTRYDALVTHEDEVQE